MKKFIYSIFAVLVSVAACTTFEVESSLPVVKPTDPTISVTTTGETEIVATVSAAEGTSFYSYAVIAGAARQLDSTSLFKLGYKSASVKYGTVDYSKNKSFEIEAKGLSRNTDYTIYAVAASEQGTVGNVVYQTVHTGDSEVPSAGTVSKNENVLTLPFSEAVTYDSTKPAYAKYYAYNAAVITDGKLVNDGAQGDADVKVAVSGSSVTFTVTLDGTNPLPAGAYYTVGYPAGAFVDALGNPCAERSIMTGLTSSGALGFGGLYGRVSTKPFDLVDDDKEAVTVAPSKTYFTYSFPEGVVLAKLGEAPVASMKVVSVTSARTSQANYNLTYGTDWGIMSGLVAVFYPSSIDIKGGDNLTVTVAADSFIDIYGNSNSAVSHEYLYSYGYKVEDIAGTYTYTATSYFGASYNETGAIVIEASDDAEKGEVMITTMFDIPCSEPYYCSFDPDGGVLTIPDWGVITEYGDDTDNGVIRFAVNGEDYLTLAVKEAGKLTDPSALFGYYYDSAVSSDNSGWGNAFSEFSATRSAAPAGVPAQAKTKRVFPSL